MTDHKLPGTLFVALRRCAAWLILALGVVAASPSLAQHCTPTVTQGFAFGFTSSSETVQRPNSCNLLPCYEPQAGEVFQQVAAGCDPEFSSCPLRLPIPLTFPGNSQMPTNTHVRVFLFNQPSPPAENCTLPPGSNCSR